MVVHGALMSRRLSRHSGGKMCLQTRTLSLQRSRQYLREVIMCENMIKVTCTLRVMLNHPYIDAENSNCSREMWRHRPRRPLVMVWTVEIESECALVQ